ncbi:amidohydrolase family protein [Sulfobacillus thermosulfidooxidans]|nr:amidohydrolase family protein [Sulfobacillus thermosulfidooxidans]
MATQRIIDMRNRPTFLHPFYGKNGQGPEVEVVRWLGKRVGAHDIDHFLAHQDVNAYLSALDDAGITHAVITGRSTPAVRIPNDEVRALVQTAPTRLIGIGAVDPLALGVAGAVDEVRHIKDLGLQGVNMDPAFLAEPLQADDARLFPVYEECQRLSLPVFLMTGPTSVDLRFAHPANIGAVANAFPRLKIVVSHGGYPFVDEMIGVAFKHENVLVSPDFYLFVAGSKTFVEAANGFMRHQLLFGTGYPFRPMKQTVEDFLRLGFLDEVLPDVLYNNAAHLLGLAN